MTDIEIDVVDVPEGMTELYDAHVPRVDLVSAAANGVPRPLIAKQAEGAPGLLDAAYVRSLIAKSEPEPEASHAGEMVTMTGSPAAIAAMIHAAAVRKADPAPAADITKTDYTSFVKAKYNADDLRRMADNGQAMDEGAYPIADREDLNRAIRAVGRGGADHDAIRRHILRRAKALGASSEIPENWAADGSLKKGMGVMEMDDGVDGMDPTVILAEPDMDAPGDPADPGSPAWEAIDAATARKWTAIAARLRSALETLGDREALEAAAVDPDDAEHAMDLCDAACAIDYAISILAPFAVDEQAEADCGTSEMEMLGKAIAELDPAILETVEAFGPVRKAGRTLSAANEAALRAAITSLQKIIASLPKAPDAPEAATGGMQKEAEPMGDNPEAVQTAIDSSHMLGTPKEPAAAETPAAAGMPDHVTKAAKPDQMAVYDSEGNLIGAVDPADLTRFMSAKPATPADTGTDVGTDDGAPDDSMDGAAVMPADDGTTPQDLTPAPADAVGTPADAVPADDDNDVAKATNIDTVPDTMLKSSIQELVKAALDEHSAEQAGIVKTLEDQNRALEERNEALVKQAASLEERLTHLENAPAVMAIASNGAIPPAHLMRGQDRGATGALTKAQEMRDAFKASDDAAKQQALATGLNALAIEELSRIHAAGPR